MLLDKIFGNKTASLLLLNLYHYGEGHPNGLAKDIGKSLSSVQNQLERFEDSGILASKKIGNIRIYFFNRKSPIVKPILDLLEIVHSNMSISDKEKLFKERKRPRRFGKPVIGRSES